MASLHGTVRYAAPRQRRNAMTDWDPMAEKRGTGADALRRNRVEAGRSRHSPAARESGYFRSGAAGRLRRLRRSSRISRTIFTWRSRWTTIRAGILDRLASRGIDSFSASMRSKWFQWTGTRRRNGNNNIGGRAGRERSLIMNNGHDDLQGMEGGMYCASLAGWPCW